MLIAFKKEKVLRKLMTISPANFINIKESLKATSERKGNLLEHKRTARIAEAKPVKHLVNLIKDGSSKYKSIGSVLITV